MALLSKLAASALGVLTLFTLKRRRRLALVAAPLLPSDGTQLRGARHYVVKSRKRVQVAVPPIP